MSKNYKQGSGDQTNRLDQDGQRLGVEDGQRLGVEDGQRLEVKDKSRIKKNREPICLAQEENCKRAFNLNDAIYDLSLNTYIETLWRKPKLRRKQQREILNASGE